jgi:hypothetical protein
VEPLLLALPGPLVFVLSRDLRELRIEGPTVVPSTGVPGA